MGLGLLAEARRVNRHRIGAWLQQRGDEVAAAVRLEALLGVRRVIQDRNRGIWDRGIGAVHHGAGDGAFRGGLGTSNYGGERRNKQQRHATCEVLDGHRGLLKVANVKVPLPIQSMARGARGATTVNKPASPENWSSPDFAQ